MVSDTLPEIERMRRKLWAGLAPGERLRQVAALIRGVRGLTRRGIRRHFPDIDARETAARFARRVYGDAFPNIQSDTAMNEPEIPSALLPIVRACATLGLRYRIGGSLASSLYGDPRATNDADIVIAMKPEDAEPFVREIGDAFLLHADSLETAIRRERSLNALHIATVFKIDIFPLKARAYDRQAHERITVVRVEDEGASVDLVFAAPEDVLIAKLEWFRSGGEVSERQWTDILGVLRAETVFLDYDYLDRWTRDLGVHDLLERALAEIAANDQPDGG